MVSVQADNAQDPKIHLYQHAKYSGISGNPRWNGQRKRSPNTTLLISSCHRPGLVRGDQREVWDKDWQVYTPFFFFCLTRFSNEHL